MFSIPIRMGAPLALTAAFGCTLHITEDPTAATTGASAGTTGTSDATAPPTTTDPTQVTATDPGTSGTSGAPTGTTAGTSAGETGPEPPQWCNGFSPEATGFTVNNNKDEVIVDGSALAAECGGQGTIMIPVYPHFGGFVPDGDSVAFDVTLDVEGYNVGPDGHFFAVASHVHKVDCGQEQDTYYNGGGYSYSFIPMFPPDGVADINVIDGKPGHLHLTLHTPDGDLPFDADVVLSAAIQDCGY